MNIFVLDEDPVKAAQYHNNKHVIKMILETAQMLCTARRTLGYDAPYRATHKSHPCTLWVSESRQNYIWLCRLGLALCDEYEFRYPGKVHKTRQHLEAMSQDVPQELPDIPRTEFRLAMPDDCKIGGNVVESYRSYYIKHKNHIAEWKSRDKPEWFKKCTFVYNPDPEVDK